MRKITHLILTEYEMQIIKNIFFIKVLVTLFQRTDDFLNKNINYE